MITELRLGIPEFIKVQSSRWADLTVKIKEHRNPKENTTGQVEGENPKGRSRKTWQEQQQQQHQQQQW